MPGLTVHGHAPIIQQYTIAQSNTWESAFSAVAGVRKWLLKLDSASSNTFRFAFVSSPTTNYMTNSGVGIYFDSADLPNIYIYGTANDKIELLYFA